MSLAVDCGPDICPKPGERCGRRKPLGKMRNSVRARPMNRWAKPWARLPERGQGPDDSIKQSSLPRSLSTQSPARIAGVWNPKV